MRVSPIAGLLLALAGLACADASGATAVGPLPISSVVAPVQERRFRVPESRSFGERWAGVTTVRFDRWHGTFSALGQRRAAVEVRQDRVVPMPYAGAEPREVERVEWERNRDSRRMAALEGLGRVRPAADEPRVERYQRLVDTEMRLTREEFVAGRTAPRLEDINRFVFRKNGTTRGELPVTPAGEDRPPPEP